MTGFLQAWLVSSRAFTTVTLSLIHNGLVKIRVGIYVAQLTKNELLYFSLFSQRLLSPESLRLEFNNGFKICQTIF